MKAGETAHVTARGLTLEGEGSAPLAGREVRVPGLFPGESAEVHIEAVSRHHPRAHARLVRLTAPHVARRPAPCPEHVAQGGACTGCALMELDEAAQRALKAAMLRERFGLDVAEVEPAPDALGYRWSAKRVAFGAPGSLALGSYARGSHSPADMARCLVDHPRLVAAFAEVVRQANAQRVAPYDEARDAGHLRAVWAKTDGTRAIVTLVASEAEPVRVLARAIAADGVLISVQQGRGNNLRGSAAEPVHGAGELTTSLLGQALDVGALGFLQPNPRVAEACYAALVDGPGGALAYDLYAGAGVTTRALRERFAEVVPCEAYPESARALGVAAETSEAFLARVLAETPRRTPELVVANPPRRGLGDEVCGHLLALGAARLHVMSCGPEGLARDLAALAHGYEVTSLRAFDTLPQTPHVELVAQLRRR